MTAKKALLTSILSMLVCITMLVGTTFAWFTDSVTSGTNKIIAGNLDVNVYYYTEDGQWANLQNSGDLFSQDLWEPGHTEIAYLKIVNEGTLAFKYTVNVSPVNEIGGVNVAGEAFKLSNYLAFAVTDPAAAFETLDRDGTRAAIDSAVVTAAVNGESTSLTAIQTDASRTNIALLPGETDYIAVIVYMPEEVGNVANYKTGTTPPEIDFSISVYAAQYTYEEDSFGDDYDASANNAGNDTVEYNYFPQVIQSAQLKKVEGDKAAKDGEDANVTEDAVANTITINSAAKVDNVEANESAASVTISNESISFDEGSSVATVTLNVVKNDEGVPASVIAVVDADKQETTNYDVDLEVIGGEFETDSNDKYVELITVSMYIGKGKTGLSLYHNGIEMTGKASLAEVALADEYYYDSTSGFVTMKVDHLSPFTAVYDAPVASIGTVAYYSLSEAVNAVAANGTIEILRDITLTANVNVPTEKGFTVNLNGYTVDETNYAIVPFGTGLFEKVYGNEKIVISGQDYIIRSGNNGYNTIAAAFEGVSDGAVINVLSSFTDDTEMATLSAKAVTLNLNGKTVTFSAEDYYIALENASLTVNGGSIYADTYYDIFDLDASSLTLTDCYIENASSDIAVSYNDSAITVNSGTYIWAEGYELFSAYDTEVVLNGGKYSYEVDEFLGDTRESVLGSDGLYYIEAVTYWSDYKAEDYSVAVDTENKIVTVSSAEELALFAYQVNGGNNYYGYTVNLAADLDLAGHRWVPIGTSSNPFRGTFKGNNHVISNMKIIYKSSSAPTVGLFGTIGVWDSEGPATASVDGVILSNVKVLSQGGTGHYHYVGALIGYANNAIVYDCKVTGTVAGTWRGVGGVIGYINNCRKIDNLVFGDETVRSSVSQVFGQDNDLAVGGIFGYYYYGCKIENCKVINADISARTLVGGIGGWINNDGDAVTFEGCVVDDCVIEGNYAVGGIAGTYNGPAVVRGCTITDTEISGNDGYYTGTYVGLYDTDMSLEGFVYENNTLSGITGNSVIFGGDE